MQSKCGLHPYCNLLTYCGTVKIIIVKFLLWVQPPLKKPIIENKPNAYNRNLAIILPCHMYQETCHECLSRQLQIFCILYQIWCWLREFNKGNSLSKFQALLPCYQLIMISYLVGGNWHTNVSFAIWYDGNNCNYCCHFLLLSDCSGKRWW